MNPIYLIVSEDHFLIQRQIKKTIGESKDQEVLYYDLKETSIEQVIEDLDTLKSTVEKIRSKGETL